MLIEPKGLHCSVHATRPQPDVQWILELDPSRAEESLDGKPFEPRPELNLRDPQVVRLVQVLQADVESGCLAGSLFGEMLGNSLMVYLAQRYGSSTPRNDHAFSGLPPRRLNRALEYIEANLDRDIHLDQLATAAGLSAFHFAKLFKQSTGSSPHQYVLQRRLERATRLLHTSEMSLAEISQQAGFADQSHFANVFRRFMGLTPSRFRTMRS
jgi:AraC family transcriptional regulator